MPVTTILVSTAGVPVECTKPVVSTVPMASRPIPVHSLTVYTARVGDGVSTRDTGASDPVGGIAAYTNVGTVGSAVRTATGWWCGRLMMLTLLYNSIHMSTGVLSSRAGRPGPNVGLVAVVNGSVGTVTSAI